MALINPATLVVVTDMVVKHGPKALAFVTENWPQFHGLMGNFGGAKGEELKKRVAELVNTLDDTERKLAAAERREARLLQVLAGGSAVAFVAGLVVCYLAFRYQLIRLG